MPKTLFAVLVVVVVCAAVLCGVWWWSNASQEAVNAEGTLSDEARELREIKKRWIDTIKREGPDDSYAAFLQEAPTLRIDVHAQAHAFGEALYEVEGIEGLSTCDPSFEFGCYHSFFGVAVNEEGIETLPNFARVCKDKYQNMSLPWQHGIGHGVVVYTDYELEDALKLCDTISDMPTGGCSSGVFMEYNFHTMQITGSERYLRPYEGDDYKPCATLPQQYQPSCYLEQVQWWENIYTFDYEKIGQLCAEIPGGNRDNYNACYHGVGNYVADHHRRVTDDVIATCARMPNEESVALCHEGASWLIREGGEGLEEASKMCEALEGEYEEACFDKLGRF